MCKTYTRHKQGRWKFGSVVLDSLMDRLHETGSAFFTEKSVLITRIIRRIFNQFIPYEYTYRYVVNICLGIVLRDTTDVGD